MPKVSDTGARLEALSHLDPRRIYVENVRSILGVTAAEALRICEDAVQQGLFDRMIEVRCPDGAVAVSAATEGGLPNTVQCWVTEDGHMEEVELPTQDLPKVRFYILHE